MENNNTTLRDGLKILDFLAHSQGPLSLTEIAKGTEIGLSKTHRLLQTLINASYVFRPEGSTRYLASLHLWSLGSAILRHDSLRAAAQSAMQSLMEVSGESVHLSLLEDLEVVYLHKVDSDNPVRAYSQIGGRMPAHCVATGKAMLAFCADATLEKIHARISEMPKSTIDPIDSFMREMRSIRKTRVAVNRGAWNAEVFGVSSPVVGRNGAIVAAIGVSGPAGRFSESKIARFSTQVRSAAGDIERALFGDAATPILPWVVS